MTRRDEILTVLAAGPADARAITRATGMKASPENIRNIRMELYRMEKQGLVFRFRDDDDGPYIWRAR